MAPHETESRHGASWTRLTEPVRNFTLIDGLRKDERFGHRVKTWITVCARIFPRSVTFATLDRVSFAEVLDIWTDQAGKDLVAPADSGFGMHRPFRSHALLRAHHQLLCTPASVRAKFEAIQREFPLDAKILLIGDDDQLSLLLASAGFVNVTVVDIDARLVRALEQAIGGRVRVRVHDLNCWPARDLVGDYALVVMDPPYSVDGIRLFMNGALRFNGAATPPRIHLYCATACLGADGLRELFRIVEDSGHVVIGFEGGVCRYPYGRTARIGFTALYAAAAAILGRWRNFDARLIPRHVFSDRWDLASTLPNPNR